MTDLVVGLMSGTSLDGVDAALVEIADPDHLELVAFRTRPYALTERDRIRQGMAEGSARSLALLHRDLGKWFSEAAHAVLEAAGVSGDRIACVASHGHTVWHESGRVSWQLGCPATIAERVGSRVVSDFRSRDVAAGGQGAPLVPMADAMLFGHPGRPRALLNIGGMANVTWVPRRGTTNGVIAFDTGPGVAVLDAVVRLHDPSAPFDVDGARAAAGRADTALVDELLGDAYFEKAPPKSTGREGFGDAYAAALVERVRARHADCHHDDCVATALELTVRSIAQQLARWLPAPEGAELLVSGGGGARNPTLMRRLSEVMAGWPVRPFADEFFDGDAKEAAAFAYLGWRTLQGLAGNVPGATGAGGPRVLGQVTV